MKYQNQTNSYVTLEFQLQEIPNGLNRSPVILSEWNF